MGEFADFRRNRLQQQLHDTEQELVVLDAQIVTTEVALDILRARKRLMEQDKVRLKGELEASWCSQEVVEI